MAKQGFIGEALEVMQEETEKGLSNAKQQVTGKTGGTGQQKQGGQAQKQSAAAVKAASQTAQDGPDKGAATPSETAPSGQTNDDPLKTFIQDMYGGKTQEVSQEEIKQKELEDKQKLEALKQQFHKEYYERLTNRPKQQEPTVAEKLEMEKKQKEEKKQQEEEKKPKDIPALASKGKGTKETNRGVSG